MLYDLHSTTYKGYLMAIYTALMIATRTGSCGAPLGTDLGSLGSHAVDDVFRYCEAVSGWSS